MIVEWDSQAEREQWGTQLEKDPVVQDVWNGLDGQLRRGQLRDFYSDVGFSPQIIGQWKPYSAKIGICEIRLYLKVDFGEGDGAVLYIKGVQARRLSP